MRTLISLFLSAFVVLLCSCASSRHTRLEIQRPFPEVRAAVERYCEPIRAADRPFGGPWLTHTNASRKQYEVIIWDQVWSGPPTVTTVIAAIRRGPDKTELRVRTCDNFVSFSTGRKLAAEKEQADKIVALLSSP